MTDGKYPNRWFAVYEFYDPLCPKLLRLVLADAAVTARIRSYGDGVIGNVHVHAVEVADYCVPFVPPVRWHDGAGWHEAGERRP